VVGADRQFAVAAVDEDGEPDGGRPAEVAERVEGRADGPAGEEHVVHQDDDLAVDTAGDVGAPDRADRLAAEVVAVHGDVEGAGRDVDAFDLTDALREPVGEDDAAGRDAQQQEVLRALVGLEDLVGDAGERPADGVGVENDALVGGNGRSGTRTQLHLSHSFPASQDGLLKDVGVGCGYSTRPDARTAAGSTTRAGRRRAGVSQARKVGRGHVDNPVWRMQRHGSIGNVKASARHARPTPRGRAALAVAVARLAAAGDFTAS